MRHRDRLTRFTWLAAALGAAGALAAIGGAVFDPGRAAFSYLAAYAAVLTLVLGALSLIMIAYVTGAHWLVPLLPLARATVGTLPLLALLFLPAVAGLHLLYPWVEPLRVADPGIRSHLLQKTGYLNVPFFLARAALYFAVWIGLAELLLRGGPEIRNRCGAIGLVPFAFTFSFAAIDWILSLMPAWWSSIYGVYVWAGGFLAALAWIAVLRLFLPPEGIDRWAPSDRSNTLGKLILTFLLFWLYIGFSQFLIIWIADVPLETTWLGVRMSGSWSEISASLVLFQFAVPFALLLPQHNRRRPAALATVAAGLLLMHYIDLYWLVLPEYSPGEVTPHWLDLATLVGVVGLTLAFGAWRLGRLPVETPAATPELAPWW